MNSRRVKVIGYAQREFYNDGIEYRNFSDDLVGNQFTSEGGTALFTLGNFKVTTNLDARLTKNYRTGVFSNYYSLNQLQLEDDKAILGLIDPKMMKLNIDKANLSNYAYFGSMREYARVTVEDIIMKWPASLFVDKVNPNNGELRNTFLNYSYDRIKNIASFDIDISTIKNDFDINIKQDGTILNTFNKDNKLRDMNLSYSDYVLLVNGNEYKVVSFTGYITGTSIISFQVVGDPFNGLTQVNYHIKPNSIKINQFFQNLSTLGGYLLNRNSLPLYTAEFNYTFENDEGTKILGNKKVTWPVSDGYNIDFQSTYYSDYLTELLDITENNDESKSNIIYNKMITKSLIEFDTIDSKMDKTLKVYGRNLDEIKKYIDGIQFINHISYNKKNNVPDRLVKNLARTMGWELTTSLFNINISEDFFTTKGELNLSPVESEIEFWRRIILNTPWIWKSKGTRKVVEFLLKFVGTPKGLVIFNEYVYKASNRVDIEEVKQVFEKLNIDFNENEVVVDEDGYPKVLKDNNNLYYQKGGQWYRKTSGDGVNIENQKGNNPHAGPYDGGYEFINQFNEIIPNFKPTILETPKIKRTEEEIFNNYDKGTFNGILPEGTDINESINSYIQVLTSNNLPVDTDFVTVNDSVIKSPKPKSEIKKEGFELGSYKISIQHKDKQPETQCDYTSFSLDGTGLVLFQHGDSSEDYYMSSECCLSLGFQPELDNNNQYVCRWKEEATDACADYTKTDNVDSNGYTMFINNETGELTNNVPTLECCTKEGMSYKEDNGKFHCLETQEALPTCEDYNFTGNYDVTTTESYAIFNYDGGTTTTVLSAECCTTNGLDHVLVNGGIKCIEQVDDCGSYMIDSIGEDGLVLFKNSDDILVNEVNKVECCEEYNYEARPNNNGTYSCYATIKETFEPELILMTRTESGMVMNIKGEPNSVVKYRITVNEASDHGFDNTLYNNLTSSYVNPANPAAINGSYCEGSIMLNAEGIADITMDTTVRPPLRDFTNNCAILEFVVFNYDNTTIDDNNKLVNKSCFE
jgi:hypothetical protein